MASPEDEHNNRRRRGRPRTLAAETEARIILESSYGLGCRAIATRLNAQQVATAHGAEEWHPATVSFVRAH